MENDSYALDSVRDYNFEVTIDNNNDKFYNQISNESNPDIQDKSNNLDEIIYQKINFNGIEEEEKTYNNNDEIDNDDKSPRFSDRELIEKITVKIEEPIESFTNKLFSFTKCQNITTMKINDFIFSFMNNLENNENFYFINLDKKKFKFTQINEEDYKFNSMKFFKIPSYKIKDFIHEINKTNKPVRKEILKLVDHQIRKNSLKVFVFFTLNLIFLTLFWLFSYFVISDEYKNFVFAVMVLIILMCSIYFIIKIKRNKNLDFKIYKHFLKNFTKLDRIVSKWNKEFFLKNGIKAELPVGNQYILLISRKNINLILENHKL